ncbi:MAG: phosphotransferase [Planctomycetota bacterium]
MEPSLELITRLFAQQGLGAVTAVARGGFSYAHENLLVTVANGERFVLRLAGERRGAAFLEKEALLYRILAQVSDLPVPRVRGSGPEGEIGSRAYLVLECLPGRNGRELLALPQAQVFFDALHESAGRLLARLHAIRLGALTSHPDLAVERVLDWQSYLTGRCEWELQGCAAVLPCDLARQVAAVLKRHRDAIPERLPSRLLHRDFKLHNLLFEVSERDGESAGVELTGILDFEWACVGDPLLDVAAADLHRRPGESAFFEGYFGTPWLPPEIERRLWLYAIIDRLDVIDRALRWLARPQAVVQRRIRALRSLIAEESRWR